MLLTGKAHLLDDDFAGHGLTHEQVAHLRSLVDQRARSAWLIGDCLVAAFGAPPVQGRNDGSGPRLDALADELGVSASWLVRLRVTSHAWPANERRLSISWVVAKHLATRPDRFRVLADYVRHCERDRLTPSLERLLPWLDEQAPRPTAVRRQLDPLTRVERLALALDRDALRTLVERLTEALATPAAA